MRRRCRRAVAATLARRCGHEPRRLSLNRTRGRAAFELNRSKQDLVAGLVAAADPETLRRVTVETTDDALAVGHAAFRPSREPDVLTVAQLAEWLQVDATAIAELAESGELPGRKLAGEWRFARDAVLDWLARR